MAQTLAVRSLLLIFLVILKLSGKSECSISQGKNGEQIESKHVYYKKLNSIPQTEEKELHYKRSHPDNLNLNEIQENPSYDNGEKKCRNKLCKTFVRHRVIRQIPSGYPSYPQQPTYSQQGQQYQNNINKPPTNNYGNNPNVNNIYPHYPNTTQHRPTYNSTFIGSPNWKNSSYPNLGYTSGSRHTYPPSPRPNYNQFSNNRYNVSQTPFYSTTHPNYYPSYNGNPYPNTNSNSAYPPYGHNNTRPMFNYPNNHNALPNYPTYNVTHNYPHTQNQNPSPYNSFTQRPPLNPNQNYYYPNQRNASLPYNPGNNYNPGQYYPTQNFAPNTPFGADPNLSQNKFSSNPNPSYYPTNYNGPQYDPSRQPPGRLSY